jgi:hypothetical protein
MKHKEFNSPDEWSKFCSYIIGTNRYVLDKYWKKFVDTILFTAAKREMFLKKGDTLVRARIGSHYEEYEGPDGGIEINYGPLRSQDIVAPLPHKSRDGRINPSGISYLYLSNDIETAILEVRPWLKQDVTVGYFEIANNLKCIDTSRDKKGHYIHFGKKQPKLSPEIKEEYVWSRINESFSRPVSSGDEHTSYIPTQYLSECFKTAGYNGIIYKSALTEKGYNIVLFNPKNAHLKGARVFQIKSIKQPYEECGNPYWCKVTKK